MVEPFPLVPPTVTRKKGRRWEKGVDILFELFLDPEEWFLPLGFLATLATHQGNLYFA